VEAVPVEHLAAIAFEVVEGARHVRVGQPEQAADDAVVPPKRRLLSSRLILRTYLP
jgi:hypothetical protein